MCLAQEQNTMNLANVELDRSIQLESRRQKLSIDLQEAVEKEKKNPWEIGSTLIFGETAALCRGTLSNASDL